MLGTFDGFVGAAVEAVEDPVEVDDAEEEDGVNCLFIAHMLFWHENPSGQHSVPQVASEAARFVLWIGFCGCVVAFC